MKKISLLSIFEAFFQPELPGPRNSHMFNSERSVGDMFEPEQPDAMGEDEIDQELSLEFKLGPTMRDPLNLSGYNVHDGSFSFGKASKPFGNYQLKTKQKPDASKEDVMVKTISMENPDQGLKMLDDKEIASALGLTKEKPKPYTEKNKEAKSRRQEGHWKDAKSIPRPIEEDVGMREKGRAYGSPITTKQPFANGVPKSTDVPFYSDEEIERELGLKEWISSTSLYNRHAKDPKAELNYFENNRPIFVMNTEEEFNKNQKKVRNGTKKKKTRSK